MSKFIASCVVIKKNGRKTIVFRHGNSYDHALIKLNTTLLEEFGDTVKIIDKHVELVKGKPWNI
jgi:hypothetical protein